MANDDTEALFLALIQLDPKSRFDRLKDTVPDIIDLLNRFSKKDMEQVCRSSDGTLFGFFLRTKTHPNIIRAELEKLVATTNNDTFLIVEVGKKFGGRGFSRAWTWLQHRQAA